jgi:hypothetical protein
MGVRPPKGMKNAFRPANHFPWKHHPPLVIPSEVEGSAVLRTFRGNVFRQRVAEWRDLRLYNKFVIPTEA